MKNKLPKIIAAHDLSGIGKASLGAVIPILSSMGNVVCPLPTAVLSTITGVFDNYTITDLTEHMKNSINHWGSLNIKFDYIYSGFLGSPEQVDVIIGLAERFESYVVVDPVFADNGKMYQTMNVEMVNNMRRLVTKANLITPNATEAQFLLNEDNNKLDFKTIKNWLVNLSDMGPEKVIITSCNIKDNMYVVAYDKCSNEFSKLKYDYVPLDIHGTGDIFTSVLVGALAKGNCFNTAITLAAQFVSKAIDITIKCNTPIREGVLIEMILDELNIEINNECERF